MRSTHFLFNCFIYYDTYLKIKLYTFHIQHHTNLVFFSVSEASIYLN